MKHVVVGTAGHIDHGKTELVKALTGVNTDRFKEEQERGITIDIGFAPLAIGFALTLIHLIGIPVTNTSVNPARSTGPAVIVGGWALAQLWLFWIAPMLGAAVAGRMYSLFAEEPKIYEDRERFTA